MNEIRPGAKLKMLIQNAGYTLKEFAPMVGMSRETLHRKLNSAILDQSLVTKAAKVLQLEEIEIMDDMIREVREPQAAYGREVEALREEIRRLKQQNAEMARELEKRGEMNSDLLEILKSLAKGEK